MYIRNGAPLKVTNTCYQSIIDKIEEYKEGDTEKRAHLSNYWEDICTAVRSQIQANVNPEEEIDNYSAEGIKRILEIYAKCYSMEELKQISFAHLTI